MIDLLTDQQAATVRHHFDSLTPEEQVRAKQKLDAYDRKKKADDQAALFSAFESPDSLPDDGGYFAQADRIRPGDGVKLRKQAAVERFYASEYGQPVEVVRRDFDRYNYDYSVKQNEAVPLEPDRMFERIKPVVEKRRDEKAALDTLGDHALEWFGTSGDPVKGFAQWQAKQSEDVAKSPKALAIWQKLADSQKERAEALKPHQWLVDKGVKGLREEAGLEGSDVWFNELRRDLVDLYRADRKAYEAVKEEIAVRSAKKAPDGKGLVQGIGESLYRGRISLEMPNVSARILETVGNEQGADYVRASAAVDSDIDGLISGVIDPVKSRREGIMKDIEEGAFMFAGSVPAMATAAAGGSVALIPHFSNQAYNQFRQAGLEKADGLALVSGTAQAAIEAASEVATAIPGVASVLAKWGVKPGSNWASQFLLRSAMRSGVELGEEAAQQAVTPLLHELAAATLDSVPDVPAKFTLREQMGEFFSRDNLAPLAWSVIPLGMLGAGLTTRQDLATIDAITNNKTAVRAVFDKANADAILAEKDPEKRAKLVKKHWPKGATPAELASRAQSALDDQRAAVKGAINAMQAADIEARQNLGISITRQNDAWTVTTLDGATVQVDSEQAARVIRDDLKQAYSDEEAQGFVAIMERFGQQFDKATISSEEMRATPQGIVVTRDGQFVREITSGKSLDDVRAQAAATGMGDDVIINGSNLVYRESVGQAASRIASALTVQRSAGQAGIITALHEGLEGNFKRAKIAGALTDDHVVSVVSKVAQSINLNKLLPDVRQMVEKVAAGKANTDEIREAAIELAVAEVLGRDGRGRRTGFKAGTLSRIIDSEIASATDSATLDTFKRFKAWLKAAKAWLQGVFGTVSALDKARREGKIEGDFDAFVDQLLGLEESVMARQVEAQVDEMVGTTHSLSLPSGMRIKPPSESISTVMASYGAIAKRNETVPVDSLTGIIDLLQPNERRRVDDLKRAISGEGGYISRLIIDGDSNVVEGQHRLQALRELEIKAVPVVRILRTEDFIGDTSKLNELLRGSGVARSDHRNQIIAMIGEIINDEGGKVSELKFYDSPLPELKQAWDNAVNYVIERASKPVVMARGVEFQVDEMAGTTDPLANSRAVPADASNVTELPDGAKLVGPTTFSITAYHGTPHKVDKFSLDKIGTGEGAQAYGWGLYFAENREVGEGYRNQLSGNYKPGQLLDIQIRAKQRTVDSWKATYEAQPNEANLNQLRMAESELARAKGEVGFLYTVELLPDEADFLDWDKSLSEQSEKIQDELFVEFGSLYDDSKTGGEWYKSMTEDGTDPKTLSEDLARIGIPGIRYLDGGSRGAGDGTRNYVIFDESLVKILEENGKPVEAQSFSLSRVTPAQDAEYMAAVEAGDMATAQRMVDEAAKAAGYNVGPVYHGTDGQRFTVFDSSRGNNMAYGPGFYFAESEQRAKLFGDNVITAFLKVDGLEQRRGTGVQLGDNGYRTKLGDWVIKPDFNSSIKSADPVTRDESGQVIPLSQRFNEADDRITYSLTPARRLEMAADRVDKELKRSPERRAEIVKNAKTNLERLATRWKDKEAATKKESLVRDLIILDAILMTLPAEVRAKVGGYVALAKLSTDEARAREIGRRIEKLGTELEKFMANDFRDQIETALDKAKSKKNAKGQLESKLTSDVAEVVDFAADFTALPVVKQLEQIGGLEKILETSDNSAEVESAISRLGVANLLHDMPGQDAEQLERVYQWVTETIKAGKEARAILNEDRKNKLTALKEDAKDSVLQGASSSLEEAENEAAEIKSSWWRELAQRVKGFLHSAIPTTAQQLELVFGADSQITREFTDRIIEAANRSTDIKREVERQRRAAVERILGTKNLLEQTRKIAKLQESQASGVFTQVGEKTETVRLDAEILGRLQDGTVTPESLGLKQYQVDEALDSFAANPRTRGASVEVVKTVGRQVERRMSQTEGIQWLLWWRQPDSRRTMEKDGWTEESLKQLDAFLTPEAKAMADWMGEAYNLGAELIDPVYRRIFNAPLPRVKNYAPIYRDVSTADNTGPIDPTQQSSGLMSSFTIARSRNASAKLKKTDALAAFLAHFEHVSHWVAFAEVVRDMKAVLADTGVQNAIKTKGGIEAAQALKTRIKAIESQGNDAAWSLHTLNGFFARLNQWRAFKGLAWRLSPILKQTSAVLNPLLADVPAGAYFKGMAKLFTGKLDVAAMWNSEAIQRRLEGGFSPEARIAMQGAGANGSVAISLMQKGMMPMSMTDAGWNTVGAAIAFDYYRGLALKSGANEELANNQAMKDVDRMLATAAQPTDLVNRALVEQSSNPFVKSMWMFASEARKTVAIELLALNRLISGTSKSKAMDVQRIIVAHGIMSVVTQVMSVAVAAIGGDDDDLERELSAEEWAYALLSGPINGVFLVGDATNYLFKSLMGLPVFTNSSPLAQAVTDSYKSTANIGDLFGDDSEKALKELDRLSTAIGSVSSALIGPQAAVVDVMGNVVRDAANIIKRD